MSSKSKGIVAADASIQKTLEKLSTLSSIISQGTVLKNQNAMLEMFAGLAKQAAEPRVYPLEVAISKEIEDASMDKKMKGKGATEKICNAQKSLRSIAIKGGVSEDDFRNELDLMGKAVGDVEKILKGYGEEMLAAQAEMMTTMSRVETKVDYMEAYTRKQEAADAEEERQKAWKKLHVPRPNRAPPGGEPCKTNTETYKIGARIWTFEPGQKGFYKKQKAYANGPPIEWKAGDPSPYNWANPPYDEGKKTYLPGVHLQKPKFEWPSPFRSSPKDVTSL